MVYAAACKPAWLTIYAKRILRHNGLYKAVDGIMHIWAFLYQCENRYRREHIPALLRAA